MAAAALGQEALSRDLALDSRYDSDDDAEDPNVIQPATAGDGASPLLTAADLKEQEALEAEARRWEEEQYDSEDDWDDDGVYLGRDVKATGAHS